VLLYLYVVNQVHNQKTCALYLLTGLCGAVAACGYGWMQFAGATPGDPGVPRGAGAMISAFGNLNFFSEFLAVWIFPGLLLLTRFRSTAIKTMIGLALALCLATLMPLATVGVWAGLALGALIAALWAWGLRLLTPRRAGLAALGALLIGVLAFGSSAPVAAGASDNDASPEIELEINYRSALAWMQPPWQTLEGVLGQFEEAGSISSRAMDWILAAEMVWANPWLGVGLGQYGVVFYNYREQLAQTPVGQAFDFPDSKSDHVHNEYLQIAAETGALGVVALAAFLWVLVASTVRRMRRTNGVRRRWMQLALSATVLALLADAAVNFPLHLPGSGLGMVLVLALLDSAALSPTVRTVKVSKLGGKGLAVIGLALAVAMLALAWLDWQADLHLERGNQHLTNGNYRLALGEYERSLVLDLAPAEVFFRMGGAHYQLGDYAAAEQFYLRSIAPFLVEDTYWNLAGVKAQQGELEAAKAYLDRLLSLRPNPDLVDRAEDLRRQIQQAEANP